jgi:hypothetical protein
MHARAIVTGLLLFMSFSLLGAQPATTNNNDSCDVAVYPAATLLLPYFEVDTGAPIGTGATTLFTITNTSRYPQIAHVTVWTDWTFPVLAFNVFLTGYDVQGINLYDVIVRGIIANIPRGTSITTVPGSPQPVGSALGSTPLSNTSNPNFVTSGDLDVSKTCVVLPGLIPPDIVDAVRNALTVGIGYNAGGVNCGSSQVGFNHGTSARGYVTVDVVSYCSTQFPTDRDGNYFSGPTAPLLFDNVLLGDYQQIGPTPAGSGTSTFDAGGSPMVHIRAVPEGGLSGASGGQSIATNLPFTFYDRYTPAAARAADRRQPLPSVWAARYIQGGAAGFATDFKIWREGITAGVPTCSEVRVNSSIVLTDIIRFDEHENSYGLHILACPSLCIVPPLSLPAASRTASWSSVFPALTGTDVGGWLYFNLSSGTRDGSSGACHAVLSAQREGFGTCNNGAVGASGSRTTSQNWVITSMFGAAGTNRLSVDFDTAALGNGCTPERPNGATIAPASHPGGSLLCPTNAKPSDCSPATRPPAGNP